MDLRPFLLHGFPWHEPDVVVGPLSATAWWDRLRPLFLNAYLNNGASVEIAEAAVGLVPSEFYRADSWELIAGATGALELTRDAGYDNVILSNHGPGLPVLVAELGLARLVTRTITSAVVGMEKPNPALFAYALAVAEAGQDTWMVGDNPTADVEGAVSAGLRAILADGAGPNPRGATVLEAAQKIVASTAF